jgi:gamma-glutamylcysteine synthetase
MPTVQKYEETIDHLISGCPNLARNEYIIRHDKVCTHLHYSISKKLGIKRVEMWYSHIPKPVNEHEDITVLRKRKKQTYREDLANRPDIKVKNKN